MSVTTLIARKGVPDNSAAWARDAASMSLQTAPLSSIIGASVGEQSSELPVVQRPVLRPSFDTRPGAGVARRCPTVKARGLASHEAQQLIGLIAATMPEYLQAVDAMKEHDHYIEKLTQSLQGLTKKTPARHEIVAGPDDEGWGG